MDGWRKSSYSDGNGGQCVEVACDGAVLVRDTTNRDGVTLNLTSDAWRTWIASLRIQLRGLAGFTSSAGLTSSGSPGCEGY